MDGLHLPEIVKLREQSGRYLGSASKNITAGETNTSLSRREKNFKEDQQSLDAEKLTRKKRINTSDRQRKASSIKNSSTSGKSIRHEARNQNTRRRYETIGLPKITANTENNTLKSHDEFGAKKPRRTKSRKGNTISYVYSKSLQDENTMAFLRNSVDFEKHLNLNYKIRNKRSSNCDKKPYGLPALKVSEDFNEREQHRNTEEYSNGSFSETESLLNAWEAIDDEISNGTNCDSADCSSGHD